MKKTNLGCLLLAFALLFSGCSRNVPPLASEKNNLTGSNGFVMPDIPDYTSDKATLSSDGFYFTGEDYNIAIYPFSCIRYFHFDLFSETPLPEDASISINTSIPYSSSITPVELTDSVETQIPYYLYQCTQSINWPQITKAYLNAQYAIYQQNQILNQGMSPTQEQTNQWKRDVKLYEDLFYASKDKYYQQLEEWENTTLPTCYRYRIGINFAGWDYSVSDVVTEVYLSLDERTIEIPVGTIRLEGEKTTTYPTGDGISLQQMGVSAPGGTPWSTDSINLENLMTMTADDAVSIKNLYIYDNIAEISRCTANLTNGNFAINTEWLPGEDTIELKAGDTLSFDILLKDKDLTNREYGKNMMLICEYEVDGQIYCVQEDIQIFRERELYEVYLWAFKNIDTQGYYQQYFNICSRINFEEE